MKFIIKDVCFYLCFSHTQLTHNRSIHNKFSTEDSQVLQSTPTTNLSLVGSGYALSGRLVDDVKLTRVYVAEIICMQITELSVNYC